MIHLHVHGCYSFLDGLGTSKQLAQRAKELGQTALALTDHGVMYGVIDHYKACNEAGIKPIIGCEVYVTQDHTIKNKEVIEQYPFENAHLVVLAKTDEGHANLRKLVSTAMLDGFYYKPRVDHALLKQYGRGLIVLSACLGGEVPQLLLRGEVEQAKKLALYYNSIFDGFYLEVQANKIPEQQVVNAMLMELSKETGIPLVVTCDAHFVKEDDGYIHKDFITIGKEDRRPPGYWEATYADAWLKTDEEILAMGLPMEAIENTHRIAEQCDVTIPMGEFKLPNFVIPEGYTLDTYLSKICHDGLFSVSLEKDIELDVYATRLNYELEVISQKGLSGYFLIVQDFLNEARRRGLMVGPGRGSAAGSLVAYTSGITQVDPIEHGLLFERFINPDRPSMPDIDIDFEDERRGEMMEYLIGKYGRDNVCQVITFGTMKSKVALKDAARILGVPYDEVNAFTKLIPMIEGRPFSIQESVGNIDEIATAAKNYPEMFELASYFEGLPRQSGVHAAGVVITPEALVEYVPLVRGNNDEVLAQYEKDTLESLGLLKFDLLGLKTLTVMRLALEMVRERHGVEVDLDHLRLDDKDTLDLISSGKTVGVFQLESEGMQSIFRGLRTVTFDALVAGISLYRPGALAAVPYYTASFNGLRHVDYPVPELEPILQDTHGVILYQEQTMKIATDLAGYTPSQADMLRKAIGKKKPEIMRQEIHKLIYGDTDQGIPGMINKNIPELVAHQITESIEKFAGYGFNKSHATGYALLAYQSAWLKAHYPLEFMTAHMTVALGNQEKMTKYAAEIMRLGFKFLPPDVNNPSLQFSIEQGEVRFPLSAIKGIGPNIAERLVKLQPYASMQDLVDRHPKKDLNKKALTALALSGAMDVFESENRMAALANALLCRGEKAKDQIPESDIKSFIDRDKFKYEEETLGFFISGHPLDGIAQPIDWQGIEDQKPFSFYAMIMQVKEIPTKLGKPMCRMIVETLEGNKDLVMFTEAYEKYKDQVEQGKIARITISKSKPGLVVKEVKLSKKYNK